MESKKLNRRLSSCFWWIIYSLPLLTLLVLFVGYLSFYKSAGNEFISEKEVITYDYKGTDYVSTEHVDKFYFNTNLSIEEVDSYLSTLEYVDGVYTIFIDDTQLLTVGDLAAMGFNGYMIIYQVFELGTPTFLYCSNSDVSNEFGYSFVGWNPELNGVVEVNSISNSVALDEITPVNPSNISGYLVSITPIELVEIISYEKSYFTIPYEEVITYDPVDLIPFSNNSKVFSFNTDMSLLDVSNLCSSIVGDSEIYDLTTDNSKSLSIHLASDGTNNFYYIFFNGELVFSPAIVSGVDINFIGWSPALETKNVFDVPSNLDYEKIALFGDLFVEEFAVAAYEEKIEHNLSLFDYSLVQSINTFDGFTLEPLENSINSLSEKVGFTTTSFIARFVFLLLTWFIQLMFIHIFIDVLAFVPRFFHECFERKC